MPNPTKDGLKELLEEVIKDVLEALGYSDHTFTPRGNKVQNKGKLAQMWEDIGQEFGTRLTGLLEDGTEDVSEWMSACSEH